MKQAMKKMGIKQTSVPNVVEVIIRTATEETVIRNADVICVEMPGSKSYQISGTETVRSLSGEPVPEEPQFGEDDIALVMSQAGCDREKAVEALKKSGGEPAEAIISVISG
ncbi:MAG: Nascent polypeptide-associated complex protein [Candidatus Methanomethylophilaceae archaeon]|nr:Nascent polypeptide-associated complex protein [Candidatus Methanomethylophilaceae archaeon]